MKRVELQLWSRGHGRGSGAELHKCAPALLIYLYFMLPWKLGIVYPTRHELSTAEVYRSCRFIVDAITIAVLIYVGTPCTHTVLLYM